MWLLLTGSCQLKHIAKQVSFALCSKTIIQPCSDKVDPHTSPVPEPEAAQEKILELLLLASLSGLPRVMRISHNAPPASACNDRANNRLCLRRVEMLAQLCKRQLKTQAKVGQATTWLCDGLYVFLHMKIVSSTHAMSDKMKGGNLGDLTSDLQTEGYLGVPTLHLRGTVISLLLLWLLSASEGCREKCFTSSLREENRHQNCRRLKLFYSMVRHDAVY